MPRCGRKCVGLARLPGTTRPVQSNRSRCSSSSGSHGATENRIALRDPASGPTRSSKGANPASRSSAAATTSLSLPPGHIRGIANPQQGDVQSVIGNRIQTVIAEKLLALPCERRQPRVVEGQVPVVATVFCLPCLQFPVTLETFEPGERSPIVGVNDGRISCGAGHRRREGVVCLITHADGVLSRRRGWTTASVCATESPRRRIRLAHNDPS